MDFGETDIQRELAQQLERFLTKHYDFQARQRRVADGQWRPDVWNALAEDLGALGAGLPEEVGGLGGGPGEVGAIMREFGRHLVLEPYLTTVVLGAAIVRAWDIDKSAPLLTAVAQGKVTIAVAHAESRSGYEPQLVATRAVQSGAGYVLNGRKTLVLNAAGATHLIVVARTGGEESDRDGVSLFLLEPQAPGLGRVDYRTIDGGSASDLILTAVEVAATSLIGVAGQGLAILERALDEATTAICAEACGVMQALLDITVDYTRQRKQFGKALAEFQVLQHRMVDMLVELKQATALTTVARIKLDTPDRAAAVSAAKSRVGRACRSMSQAAVQLHGGVGIADETPISHYFRRALMIEQQFGSTDYHLDRYERLQIETV
jgi:alkylation response protein AidB-like acyl-CoA dehydrogenase